MTNWHPSQSSLNDGVQQCGASSITETEVRYLAREAKVFESGLFP